MHVKAIGEPQEALVYCLCDWSKLTAQIWKLPRVNKKIEGAFEVVRCPLGWFLPDNERDSVPRGKLLSSMQPIVKRWHERIRSAESFWREYGALFDERPQFWNEPPEGA